MYLQLAFWPSNNLLSGLNKENGNCLHSNAPNSKDEANVPIHLSQMCKLIIIKVEVCMCVQ